MFASLPDLLRLLAVPAFGWAAWRDIQTRRVPNRAWPPLLALGIFLLVWEFWHLQASAPFEQRLFSIRVAFSLGIVVPFALLFYVIGGFGGADFKAFVTLAVLFPTYPTYYLPSMALPQVETTLGIFSLTIITNGMISGVFYPIGLFFRNAGAGRFDRRMFVARPVSYERIETVHGVLLIDTRPTTRTFGRETVRHFFESLLPKNRGLDLDALRMYLNWRGATLDTLRRDPEASRDPASLPEVPHRPGDGAVTDGGPEADKASDVDETDSYDAVEDDCWGANAFLSDIEGDAYGTTPEQLREGLELAVSEDEVWVTPGIPFLVPVFAGLVVALTYGDLLFAVLRWIALV